MAQNSEYIIAVDGGGTGCRVRLAERSGRELASAVGGPANVSADFDAARESVLAAISQAYHAAGLAPERRRHDIAWLGLAGAGVGDLARRMEQALGFARIRVTTDCVTAVEGALGCGKGTVALLGTGSFFVRRQDGRDRRIGGWGYQLGDEAGGAWLGRELLRCVLHAFDGLCEHSALSREILAEYGNSPGEIVRFAQHARPGEMARLAPRIAAARSQGDPLAQRIMTRAVGLICDRLEVLGAQDAGALHLLGGLAPVYAPLLPEPLRRLLRPPRGSALDGAVALAIRHLAEGKKEAGHECA